MALLYSAIVSVRADTRARRATTGLVLPIVPCDSSFTFSVPRTLRITFGTVARAATPAPAKIAETPAVTVKRMAFRQSHIKPFIYTPHHGISISRTSYAANFGAQQTLDQEIHSAISRTDTPDYGQIIHLCMYKRFNERRIISHTIRSRIAVQ